MPYQVNGRTFEYMNGPGPYVVRRYAIQHPGVTLGQLQDVFADDPHPGGFRALVHDANEAIVIEHLEWFSAPVRLDDGTFFVVTKQWDGPTLEHFIAFSNQLADEEGDDGYRIVEI